jgi:citrate lyase beta subunit
LTPDQQLAMSLDVELAKRIEAEFSAGQARGQGAIAIDGKMIDKPVLDRALQQLELLRRFTLDN